jgi:hypothetical protein
LIPTTKGLDFDSAIPGSNPGAPANQSRTRALRARKGRKAPDYGHFRRQFNLRFPECPKTSEKIATFSNANLKYSQNSETGGGEWVRHSTGWPECQSQSR